LEGDWEVVMRSGRDEPIWVVKHMCMEALLGIYLYSCLYLISKSAMSFLLPLMLQQNWRRGQNRFLPGSIRDGRRERGVESSGERWPKQCIHI
jgi:hypothetical protein